MGGSDRTVVAGRLVLADRVRSGRVSIVNGVIDAVDEDDTALEDGPYVAAGFVDLHVHGFGGHDAMGPPEALDGMSRALSRRGVTSFLPTAVTAPLPALAAFADRVRAWLPVAPADGAAPLGFDLEGPFLAVARHGAHDTRSIVDPADVPDDALGPLLDGLRLTTIAPERPGAIDLIRRLTAQGVVVALGHSAATLDEARTGYAAGARSTTHLFNAMTGVDHKAPGLAVAALTDDDVAVELIADGHHVHPGVWPLITRMKLAGRLVLISDAVAVAGTDATTGTIGSLPLEIRDGRATLAGTTDLAGSVIGLDDAVRNLVRAGIPLPRAVAAASSDPATLIGADDRGRLAVGQRADLVELDDDLRVRRVMTAGRWRDGG